jgi:hypothetical protein
MLPSSSASTQSTLLDRGVYVAPLLTESGEQLMFAVDAGHHLIAKRAYNSAEEESSAARWLWRILDNADPLLAAVPILSVL